MSSGLADLACPVSTECVAVDAFGREVAFAPGDPSGWSAYAIDGSYALNGVSCAAASQCVAVDHRGAEVTFDPERVGAAPRRHVIDSRHALTSVACPSVDLCVAVDGSGHAVTFDPENPSSAQVLSLGGSTALSSVACPSTTQCTVLDSGRSDFEAVQAERMVTFDPQTAATVSVIQLPGSADINALTCPTIDECVGAGMEVQEVGGQPLGEGGVTVAFNPTSSTVAWTVTRSAVWYLDVACVSASVCTAMDASGAEVSFDPYSLGVLEQAEVDPLGDWSKGFNGSRIACTPSGECVLATTTSYASGAAITFAPLSPGKPVPVPIDDGAPLAALACPAGGDCVGLANAQCALCAGPLGVAELIGPGLQSHVEVAGSLPGRVGGFACPDRNSCTVVTNQKELATCAPCAWASAAMTFDPAKLTSRRSPADIKIDTARISGLACPDAHQCTAVDARGREVNFNPHHAGARSVHRESAKGLTSVACPSVTQCTAVGENGTEVTFLPATGAQMSTRQIDAARPLTAVACPTAKQCSAVDQHGRVITFDPQHARRLVTHQVGSAALTTIACPSRRFCIAVSTAGDAAAGDPVTRRRWALAPVPGASSLLAVACTSATACVAGDSTGHMFETTRSLAR